MKMLAILMVMAVSPLALSKPAEKPKAATAPAAPGGMGSALGGGSQQQQEAAMRAAQARYNAMSEVDKLKQRLIQVEAQRDQFRLQILELGQQLLNCNGALTSTDVNKGNADRQAAQQELDKKYEAVKPPPAPPAK